MDDKERLAANRRRWDRLADLHLESPFYDVAGFRAGRPTLDAVELEGVGDVTGQSLLHLQCHFGLATLDWARRGARTVGVDFSARAIRHARKLADELKLEARFVEADVCDALPHLGGERFDVVFTSYGTISWLPELRGWARTIAGSLKPGGRLFLADFHPLLWMFDETSSVEELTLSYPYFAQEALREEERGSYAVPDADFTAVSYSWQHTFEDIIGVLLAEGLAATSLREYPYLAWKWFDFMVQGTDGFWRMPEGAPDLPLMFSITARAPEQSSLHEAGADTWEQDRQVATVRAQSSAKAPGTMNIRRASARQAALLAHQRAAMFRDMGVTEEADAAVIQAFEDYATAALEDGRLIGWLAMLDDTALGGLAAHLQDGPPMAGRMTGRGARLIDMFVEPAWRRRGVARALLRHAMHDLAAMGVETVDLVASAKGRPLYVSEGFVTLVEMRRPLRGYGQAPIQ
ncbi:MAG: GNAT family N-acetyltransferase, partial [Gaiellales bacterium]|nr:GNAT family N-acetyltransferase [Gaiellales bacterium]